MGMPHPSANDWFSPNQPFAHSVPSEAFKAFVHAQGWTLRLFFSSGKVVNLNGIHYICALFSAASAKSPGKGSRNNVKQLIFSTVFYV